MNSKACNAGEKSYCNGLDNMKTMSSRVSQVGPLDAFHMFMVDQGISNNKLGRLCRVCSQ